MSGLALASAHPGVRRDERGWLVLVLTLLLSIFLLATPAFAQEPAALPDRPLANASQEARAQALFDVLRCVVCQHESIADSPAGIAGDMRRAVREQIATGATDEQVLADMVRRYGDFVLFKPPVTIGTWLLWFGPFALAAGGGLALLAMARRRRVETETLSPEEETQLNKVLQSDRFGQNPVASPPHAGRSLGPTDDAGAVGVTPPPPVSKP
ncbi:MAG: cytochrome c-type biogenesis protein CcmH [Alphaproteobacteria bacterium]|nr:MAG: cytochrome c-type biogenesis protein CcmH [Alphaproteobacteria bacterium]PZO32031.1 MAG: cytochrome c-type biogenesis protein CcmH [Alphaproteobacteria bacterium]